MLNALSKTVEPVRYHAMPTGAVFTFLDHFAVNATGLCVKLSESEFVSFANTKSGPVAEIEEPRIREVNFPNGLCVVYDLQAIMAATRGEGA